MPNMQPKQRIPVVGAVIIRHGLVLCARRGSGELAGFWEFPGGKIKSGETPRAALRREIVEELAIAIDVGAEITTTEFEYDFGIVALSTFYCTIASGNPARIEHAELRWVAPTDLEDLRWAPADIPAVTQIIRQSGVEK